MSTIGRDDQVAHNRIAERFDYLERNVQHPQCLDAVRRAVRHNRSNVLQSATTLGQNVDDPLSDVTATVRDVRKR